MAGLGLEDDAFVVFEEGWEGWEGEMLASVWVLAVATAGGGGQSLGTKALMGIPDLWDHVSMSDWSSARKLPASLDDDDWVDCLSRVGSASARNPRQDVSIGRSPRRDATKVSSLSIVICQAPRELSEPGV